MVGSGEAKTRSDSTNGEEMPDRLARCVKMTRKEARKESSRFNDTYPWIWPSTQGAGHSEQRYQLQYSKQLAAWRPGCQCGP